MAGRSVSRSIAALLIRLMIRAHRVIRADRKPIQGPSQNARNARRRRDESAECALCPGARRVDQNAASIDLLVASISLTFGSSSTVRPIDEGRKRRRVLGGSGSSLLSSPEGSSRGARKPVRYLGPTNRLECWVGFKGLREGEGAEAVGGCVAQIVLRR